MMSRIKLEQKSNTIIITHNIEAQNITIGEPHVGEPTRVESVVKDLRWTVNKKNSVLHLAGDLLNADDLRIKGMLTEEFIIDDIDEFRRLFLEGMPEGSVKVLLQQNHGTRMYNKELPRQFGNNITDRWEKLCSEFKLTGTIILPKEDIMYELHLTNNKGKVMARGMVIHPVGLANPNAYLNRVKGLFGSGYDFIIAFHFHQSFYAEIIRQIPNNYIETTEFKCVPPMIENPKYGRGKYAPIHAGFLVIHLDKDFLGRQIINYEVVQK
jgi:hypothetical protein